MRKTELRNPASLHIDTMSAAEMVEVMQQENENAARAVRAASAAVAEAIERISARMLQGGRLFYVGCGTSGRLGVLDASECPPTFGVSPDLVIGIIAGGDRALRFSVGASEDSAGEGRNDLAVHTPTALDTVVGISAAGGAAYVLGALAYAASVGALTVGISSTADSALLQAADLPIYTDTGAEVVAGSTRMKAGTAQKMVLNMLSTGVMIRLGTVYENMMINLRPLNGKLIRRMCFIVSELCDADEEEALGLLESHGWSIREAVEARRGQKL